MSIEQKSVNGKRCDESCDVKETFQARRRLVPREGSQGEFGVVVSGVVEAGVSREYMEASER